MVHKRKRGGSDESKGSKRGKEEPSSESTSPQSDESTNSKGPVTNPSTELSVLETKYQSGKELSVLEIKQLSGKVHELPEVPSPTPSPPVSGTRERVKLNAKGYLKLTNGKCKDYRVPWSKTTVGNRVPLGLDNLDGTCYRNAALQMLMSIPAFVLWLEKFHGPALCSLDHCYGCQIFKIYRLIYPEDPTASIDFELQAKTMKEADDFFLDKDGFFERNGLGLEEDEVEIWKDEGRGGGGHPQNVLEFLFKVLSERTSDAARDEISSMFGFCIDEATHSTCPKDSSHDYTYPLERYRYPTIGIVGDGDRVLKSGVTSSLDAYLRTIRITDRTCLECEKSGIETKIKVYTTFMPSPRRNPEVLLLDINYEIDMDNLSKIPDHIPFPDCLDMTEYLTAERQEQGEQALYRLSGLGIERTQSALRKNDGHATAIVRNPERGWTWSDDHMTLRNMSLKKILNHAWLAPDAVGCLVYVKAVEDTTSGDPPGVETAEFDHMRRFNDPDYDDDEGILFGEEGKTRERGWIEGFAPGTHPVYNPIDYEDLSGDLELV